MVDKPKYDEWITDRRVAEPSHELVDRVMAAVMAAVEEREEERDVHSECHVHLADRMNQSRSARWAACIAAGLVGSLPFLFVAQVAKLLVF